MYASTSGMGTLDVQVASSTGASCASLGGYAGAFSLSSNQGDLWTAANVSFDAFAGGSIQIREMKTGALTVTLARPAEVAQYNCVTSLLLDSDELTVAV